MAHFVGIRALDLPSDSANRTLVSVSTYTNVSTMNNVQHRHIHIAPRAPRSGRQVFEFKRRGKPQPIESLNRGSMNRELPQGLLHWGLTRKQKVRLPRHAPARVRRMGVYAERVWRVECGSQ